MIIFYLIKDVETNKFYGNYRIDDYWTNDMQEVYKFNTEDEAIDCIQSEQVGDFFDDKYLSLEKIYLQ